MIHDRVIGNKDLPSFSLRPFLIALLLAFPYGAVAHDIPIDVAVQAFVKPEGQRLRLLVRTPLYAMRDVDFPEREKGYLDLVRLAPMLPDVATLWLSDFIQIYEGETLLGKPRVVATQVSLESDRSFASYEEAAAHLSGPKLADSAGIFWNHVMLDVLFEYTIQSDRSRFSIHPALERLATRVITVLRFLPPGGAVRAYEFPGDPGLVHLDPRWGQAAGRFVQLGFFHILDGTDHLLFLLCLVIPFRRFGALIPVVTAFTVAHSITLIASAYNMGPDSLWFPPLIETLIAISIVYMALENIAGAGTVRRRWMIAFGFGLVHGFGFSFALRETLQFAGSHLLTSLLSFNVGVELGQLLVLLVLIPALDALFRYVVAERMGTIILSALVAHTGWHWMTERADRLRQFRFQAPAVHAALLANAMRWLLLILVVGGAVWVVAGLLRPRVERSVSDTTDG
jgi:HupE / UreJ protein